MAYLFLEITTCASNIHPLLLKSSIFITLYTVYVWSAMVLGETAHMRSLA